jgi:hypothetical protein
MHALFAAISTSGTAGSLLKIRMDWLINVLKEKFPLKKEPLPFGNSSGMFVLYIS